MQDIETYDFSEKKVLVRVDFNVPLDGDFKVVNDTRIRAALGTITKILNRNGSVILISHLGRPKGEAQTKFSLKHVVPELSNLLGRQVKFAEDCKGDDTKEKAHNLKAGQVLLLENVRFYAEETAGDEAFAEALASYGDVYINDAFSMSHRSHASMYAITTFFPEDKMLGMHVKGEIENMDRIMNAPEHPFTAIIGGAKVSGKIDIITRLLKNIDNLIIGGGMAYTFLRASGGSTGDSLVEEECLKIAEDTLRQAEKDNVNVILPQDTIIADGFDNEANTQICNAMDIPSNWMGLDIGPKTIEETVAAIAGSKNILWNGPMGVFEMPNFETGTKEIAMAVAEATAKGSYSLIGGGDSLAAVKKYNLTDKISYVSTGGGAMLDYIGGKDLPGIKAITN